MTTGTKIGFPILAWWILWSIPFAGADTPPTQPVPCPGLADSFFVSQVWNKVVASKCLGCHRQGGDAEKSRLVFTDPAKVRESAKNQALQGNQEALTRLARIREQGKPLLLQKVVGGLDHGGEEVLKPGSPPYQILANFVESLDNPGKRLAGAGAVNKDQPPFFQGVKLVEGRSLLRRATLSLAGRLPTEKETALVARDGLEALTGILDGVMREEAYFVRLREGFNDIFLTQGIDGNADQTVLSYEHFEKTRHWYQKYDLSSISDKNERQRAEWRMAGEYRKALLDEPMRLIDHIVRNGRPFTEIVTADFIMVSPYSARGYGVFEEVRAKFKNPEDPFEYVPVKLKALVGRSKEQNQESANGFYPHAGMLSTFQYLTRYPTTETNRNRLRARMYYQHFLGVDVLELAARVSDAAAVTAKYKVPTMEAAECVVCHRTLDPVAGLFQDYWRFADQGVYGKRKGGWFADMFAAGFEDEKLPADQRWRSLQWLGEHTAKDPRFAVAMTEHVYTLLTGRKVLLPPKDLEDPLYPARYRAYAELRRKTEAIASRFAQNGYDLRDVFKDWILSEFYRAEGLAGPVSDPCRKAELEDVGVARMLSPEQLERKISAVFGEKWGRLTDQVAILYGGIDSKEVTERATDPGGAMGAIQRTLSNDVACKHVAKDFAKPANQRILFPGIEPEVIPGVSEAGDRRIRDTVVHLHARILGRQDATDSAEVERTFRLFADLVREGREKKGLEKRESYFCRPRTAEGKEIPEAKGEDPLYTIRAWRGVVTYLLRRPEFLYE